MSDSLTILTHKSRVLAKTWNADGTVTNYSLAKYFDAKPRVVESIDALSRLLSTLEKDPYSCLIRGVHVTGKRAPRARRIIDEFSDQPLHTVLIEIDKFTPVADPVLDPVGAIDEYGSSELPSEFAGCSYHWQLSNSAGHPGKQGLLKAHVWFWLGQARDSASLRAWAKANGIKCDHAVFSEVQIHYTSAPVMGEGVVDPVPVRSGFVQGIVDDAVWIDIPEVDVGERRFRKRGEGEGLSDEIKDRLEVLGKVIGYGKEGSVYIECPFKEGHTGGGKLDKEDGTAYYPAGSGGFEQGHFKCLHQTCIDSKNDMDFKVALGLMEPGGGFGIVTDAEAQSAGLGAGTALASVLDYDLKLNDDGLTIANVENLHAVLTRPELCGQHICYDTFRDEIVWKPFTGNAVGDDQVAAVGGWRPLKDTDYTRLRAELALTGFLPIGREMMRDCVHRAAVANRIDTAQEWLSGLVWDGVHRVAGFLQAYMGADGDAYNKAVSQYMWVALAGRIIEPGCKADAAPIFVGEQYIGKSHAVASMVPDRRCFTEVKFDDNEDNLSRKMRGKLIAEFAELRGLHTKEMEAIKAFISRQEEEWVPKYMEFSTIYPRRLLFIGTSNRDEIFADETGNRRWFPIEVKRADIPAIKNDRDQLWAEGAVMFRDRGIHYYYDRANGLAQPIRDNFMITDPWEEHVLDWLHENDENGKLNFTREFLQIGEIMWEALGIQKKDTKKFEEMRIAKILMKIGYERKQKRINGIKKKIWLKKEPPVPT